MSTWPLVKFVDSPSTTATVRYDCNDQAATPVKKVTEFDPGVPTLEGEPDAVGQQWGFRSPRIVHTIKGTKAQAMAALSAVSKEQLRRTNWLLFQPSAATSPVWFKTYRTGYEAVSLERVWVRVDGGGTVPLPDTWKITIPLVADAFAYGARVTIPSVQIVQSPADVAGPKYAMRYALPAIKGDAPTRLRVSVTPTAGATANSGSEWLIGCVSGTAAMTDAVVGVTGMTPQIDTTGPAAGTGFFNGVRMVTTFTSGPGLGLRATGTLPVLPRGRYRLDVRCEAVGVADVDKTYTFKAVYYSAGFGVGQAPKISLTVPGQAVAATFRGWVNLGEIAVPFGAATAVPADVSLTIPAGAFGLDIGSVDTTGTVRFDAFRLIPIDGPTVTNATFLGFRPGAGQARLIGGVTGTWDGDNETFWASSSGALRDGAVTLEGGFPTADPAAEKNMLIVTAVSKGDAPLATTDITYPAAESQVVVSYLPRYLHVGDGS